MAPPTRAAVLAIDVGTSSVRSAVYSVRGARLAGSTARRRYPLGTGVDGRAELEPATLLGAARACLDDTHAWLESAGRSLEVVAAGASCFWHSTLGTDARGKALTPVITWADTRAAGHARRLRQRVDERHYHASTGCMLHSSFWPARLRWLAGARPALARRVALWMSPGEWLAWRLVGVRRCAHGMATGTGLYDPAALGWHADALALAGLAAERLLPIDDTPGTVSRAAARRWPRFAGAAWLPAIGDGAAGNLGSGAVTADTLALNFGTSAAVRIARRGRPRSVPFGLFAYRLDAARYLVGGATSNAGIVRQWATDTLRLPLEGEALDRYMAGRPPGAHGLDVLPFLAGERAPYWRDDLTATLAGLRIASTPLDIVTALTEASYQRLALIARAVPGATRRTAIVSGALARSRTGLALLADVTGLRLRASREAEASLRGAAVLALERAGFSPPAPALGRPIDPHPGRARAFARLRARHLRFEAAHGGVD